MTLAEATALIQNNHVGKLNQPQQWADLGCGSGLFSKALLQLLPASSVVYAVDKQAQSFSEKQIHFYQLDVENDILPFNSVNGILIANALHYVKNKSALIKKIKKILQPGGSFIIVEYDYMQANRWVPFPVDFISLKALFTSEGFDKVEKINERPSLYNRGNMYSAYIYNSNDF